MAKNRAQKARKRATKSPRSPSTKKSSAYTRTSSSSSLHKALVEGFSMWPSLRQGDLVFWRKYSPTEIEAGDIVVLKGKDRNGREHLRVHRILDRVGPYFLEAGDNTYRATLVPETCVLGKVERAKDTKGKSRTISHVLPNKMRFRFFQAAAHTFLFGHEWKDRFLGQRKSVLLWKLSVAYREALQTFGIEVPNIPPRA